MKTLEQAIEENRKRAYAKYVKEAKTCAVSFGCSVMTFDEYKEWKNRNVEVA
jgi:hypothetical protein